MIIYKCDICGKTAGHLENYIFYKRTIDCCSSCKELVEDYKQRFRKQVKYEHTMYNMNLKNAENKLFREIKKEATKDEKITKK